MWRSHGSTRPVGVLAAALTTMLFALAYAAPAAAQIRIGQTAGFTGPSAANVKELTDGAAMYFESVNASGGINGQKIQLESLDDGFDPKAAAENARRLIEERSVVALFLTRGTPHTIALLPHAEKAGVAVVAPSTGAMSLHKPVNRLVFNVRATYQREAERAVAQFATVGVKRISVLHVDDSFGADGLAGAMKGFAEVGLKPTGVYKYDREKWKFDEAIGGMVKDKVDAVIAISSGQTLADFVKQLRAAGSDAQVATLSNNATGAFVKALGEHSHGVIVSQVFPNERSATTAFTKEAMRVAAATGRKGVTPAMLEGYAAARVMVEGLRRTGPKISRETVLAGLASIRELDLGGLILGYGPDDRTGLEFVEMSIIGRDGSFVR